MRGPGLSEFKPIAISCSAGANATDAAGRKPKRRNTNFSSTTRERKMTPTQLATRYCANCRNGICTGCQTNPNGYQSRFRSEGSRCLLFGEKPCRCRYLEEFILPMASWTWKNQREGAEFKNAVHTYRICIVGEKGSNATIRRCPDCQQNTIGPRQRYCDECKARRRTEPKAPLRRSGESKTV